MHFPVPDLAAARSPTSHWKSGPGADSFLIYLALNSSPPIACSVVGEKGKGMVLAYHPLRKLTLGQSVRGQAVRVWLSLSNSLRQNRET